MNQLINNMDLSDLSQIKTKVHPLNLSLKQKVKNPELFITDRPAHKIRLLTYNIQMIPKVLSGTFRSGYQEERLLDIFKSLDNYDIVCLQEAWGFFQEIKQMIQIYSQKAGFLYYTETRDPAFASTYLGDSGLIILSRFEIKKSHFIQFSFGIHNDGWSRRGVQYAQISIGGKMIEEHGGTRKIKDSAVLHLFTSHMQSSYYFPTDVAPQILKQAIQCRTEQIRELSSLISEQVKLQNLSSQDMILLTGDLNICGKEIDQILTKKLIAENPDFQPVLKELYMEYRILIELLSNGQKHEVINMLELDLKDKYKSICTYGDYYINEIGQPIAYDQVLTVKNEQCSKELLDYIFNIRINEGINGSQYNSNTQTEQSNFSSSNINVNELITSDNGKISSQSSLKLVPGSCQVQKFLIKGRTYTQLSDHYGLSIDLEYIEKETFDEFDNEIDAAVQLDI
eukprot:403348063